MPTRTEKLRAMLKAKPHYALALAAAFHLMVTLSIFAAGRSGVVQQFDRDGIGDFASDGHIHKPIMDSLVDTLKQGKLREWINCKDAFHVKLFSLSGFMMGPLVGSNILTIEPINLLCYLAILVITLD